MSTYFFLVSGMNRNSLLQKEWNEFGEEAFEIEVLETLEVNMDKYSDVKDDAQGAVHVLQALRKKPL